MVGLAALVFVAWQESIAPNPYREAFEKKYGNALATFEDIGEEGFKARWLTEDEEQPLNCETFETCTFIELATINRCKVAVKITFSLLEESDQVVKVEELLINPLEPGVKRTLELGTNTKEDFAYFYPDDITCIDDPIGV